MRCTVLLPALCNGGSVTLLCQSYVFCIFYDLLHTLLQLLTRLFITECLCVHAAVGFTLRRLAIYVRCFLLPLAGTSAELCL